MYRRYRRYYSIDNEFLAHFPSSQFLLDNLSQRLMQSAAHIEEPEDFVTKLKLSFSEMTRLS